jgi:heat shock protein HtpX
MALALVLVAVAYAAVVVPLGYVVFLFASGPSGPASLGTVLVWTGGLVGVGLALTLFTADGLVLLGTDARDLPPDHALYGRVERLARGADLPVPDLAVVPSDEPNAFTLGGIGGPLICVTTGLLETLDDEELDAVLAHELAHVKHADALVLTVAAFPMTVGLLLLSAGADVVSLDPRRAIPGILAAAAALLLLLVTVPPVVVLSRYREFAADRGAVAITGDPPTLVTALRRLGEWSPPPDADLRRISTLSAFCVVPPIEGTVVGTHPSTEARVERLQTLARTLASSGSDP